MVQTSMETTPEHDYSQRSLSPLSPDAVLFDNSTDVFITQHRQDDDDDDENVPVCTALK